MSSSFQIRLTKIIYRYENKTKIQKTDRQDIHFSKKKHLLGEETDLATFSFMITPCLFELSHSTAYNQPPRAHYIEHTDEMSRAQACMTVSRINPIPNTNLCFYKIHLRKVEKEFEASKKVDNIFELQSFVCHLFS